jgi:hypothetical protein
MSIPANDTREAIARARHVGLQITDYIKFADAKAGLILTLVGALGAVAGYTAPSTFAVAKQAGDVAALVFLGAQGTTAVSVALVLYFTFEAVYPRSNPAHAPLVSFPDIAVLKPEDYAEMFARATLDEVLRDCAFHNSTLARVAVAKFNGLSRAMWWARLAIFSSYAAAVTYGIAEVVKPAEPPPYGSSGSVR